MTWEFLFPPSDLASVKDALEGTNKAIQLVVERRARCGSAGRSEDTALANLEARRERLLQVIGEAQVA